MSRIKAYEGLKPEQYQTKYIVASVKTEKGNYSTRQVYADNKLNKDTLLFVGNLEFDERLAVDMPYVGKGKSNANSQGWMRSNFHYTSELYAKYPEAFSEENTKRMCEGRKLIVDQQFSEVFGQYKGFEGESLVHHHIGGDGTAAAIPSCLHIGSGGIQSHEDAAGITANGLRYTDYYAEQIALDPEVTREQINEDYSNMIAAEGKVDKLIDSLYSQSPESLESEGLGHSEGQESDINQESSGGQRHDGGEEL